MSDLPRIWIVSEHPRLPETLAAHLGALGGVWTGTPDPGEWKEAPAPDLIALVGVDAASGDLRGLERLLGFLRGLERRRRLPPAVLYLEPPGGHPPGELAEALIDDRPVAVSTWPLEPHRLVASCSDLLDQRGTPLSLRERERREWVSGRVERLYAQLELPGLRHAIDPRNAARPVLLVGEPGTGKGLLARYIHNLAEPARDALLFLNAHALPEGSLEQLVLERSAGRRVTIYVEGLDLAGPQLQAELAHCLQEGGLLGIEPIRWIASARRTDRLEPALRWLGWLRVDLPPLRERPDLALLAAESARAVAARSGRRVELSDAGLERVLRYGWPGNLRELESVLERSLASLRGDVLGADQLAIGDLPVVVAEPEAPAPGPEPLPAELLEERELSEEPAGAADREAEPVASEPAEPEPAEAEPEGAEPVTEPAEAEPEEPATEPGDVGDLAVELEPPAPAEAARARADLPRPGADLADIAAPLAQELRQPLLAIRTCATLLEQRPEDESVRRELQALADEELGQVELALDRLERYASFERPVLGPVDLSAIASSELERRRGRTRSLSLVILEELEQDAPPAQADEAQLRFALGGLLDRALRMVPPGGDLYLGSLYHPAQDGEPARHRLLLRFHSPEDVLVPPEDVPAPPMPIEVVFARELLEGMGGTFAVDSSGAQDNVVLIELPA